MPDLPMPLLGSITAITITTPDLEESIGFYNQLGLSLVQRNEWPFPWAQVSDGALLIMLRKDPKPYIALTFYAKDVEKVVKKLEEKAIKFDQKAKKSDVIKRHLFHSPDGLNISLVSMVDGFKQPPGPGMLHMPQQDYFDPDKYLNKTIGMYGEFAHPVKDLDASLAFWETVGFKAVSKFSSPYPWAIISDGLAVVGLHQADHFTYPAITYFAVDMDQKITALKKKGLKDYTVDGPGNIRLTTPEQQHIFLFSLGGTSDAGSTRKKINQLIIETERLRLKAITPAILDELFGNYTDDEIKEFLGLENDEQLETEKNKWRGGYTTYRSTMIQFLLEEKSSGKIVGQAGFHNWYAMHNRAEIGYAMRNENAKNKGYMKEALKEIIDHGFSAMNLNRIEAYIGTDNIPSLKLVRGYGFTEEGLLRDHYNHNGSYVNDYMFSLLKKEYSR